jgi:tetrapyrrole methylase family protein/MazG family protein
MMKKFERLAIVGVGCVEVEALELLRSATMVLSRDDISKRWLESINIGKFKEFCLLPGQSLETRLGELLTDLNESTKLVYVTSISPIAIDQVANSLLTTVEVGEVGVFGGSDPLIPLMNEHQSLDLSSLLSMDGLELVGQHHPPFSPAQPVLIYAPFQVLPRQGVYQLLNQVYPNSHTVYIKMELLGNQICWKPILLKDIPDTRATITALFIPPMAADTSLESFQEVIAHLRAPEDGCPWDRKQTHASLRTYLLEETYEALDTLDKGDTAGLKEELGDILLQILLHAQIAAENGEFTLADVLSGINRKIVYRHPHVFKDWSVNSVKDVVENWEALKDLERKNNGDEEKKGMLDGVPVSFPALAQAQAIQDRAARVGFDWPEIAPVIDKIFEELEEVRTAPDEPKLAGELGDLLFAIVNLVRWHKVDAESALRQTNLKFRKRFAYIEDQARRAGRDVATMTLEEMDTYWEQAKDYDD